MAVSIETYIGQNPDTINKWLVNLFSEHTKKLLEGIENAPINMNCVCSDERRAHKAREVLGHYGLVRNIEFKEAPYNPYCRGYTAKPTCSVTISHKVFLKMAAKFGKPFSFEIKSPDKSTDRIKGFPTLRNISREGVIHIFFHPDRYTIYDRREKYEDRSGSVQERHVIRIYPKKLENKAERDVFEKALNRYYIKHIDEYVAVACGFQPEVITNHKKWGDLKEEHIKELSPERLNDFTIEELNKKEINERIKKAKEHLKFYEATLSDLTLLKEKLPNRKIATELVETFITTKAPLMMSSEERITRELAALVMKGSDKGLI